MLDGDMAFANEDIRARLLIASIVVPHLRRRLWAGREEKRRAVNRVIDPNIQPSMLLLL